MNEDVTDPYVCRNPSGMHCPTQDNPMRTGRCLACRAFVGLTRIGWRKITWPQAFAWGLHGARWQ